MKKNQHYSMPAWAMRYRQIIILLASCLVAFGIYGLVEINKNEFPDYTIREGMVIAVYPGATSDEIELQVTKPLEDFIFQYKEVNKEKTDSQSKDGLSIISMELNDDLTDKNGFWSKFKHDISVFRSELPEGLAMLEVNDDFGDVSAVLITMESDDKTYKELNDYMDILKDSLRMVPSVGKLNVYGMQNEQITIYLDNERLSQYGVNDIQIAQHLSEKGYVTTAGRLKSAETERPIYVGRSISKVHEIGETIVYYDDNSGRSLRLRDVARIVREYPEPDSYVTVNGRKALVLSVEMKKGQDISRMGAAVNEKITHVQQQLPADVHITKINDKSKVVDDSVYSFLTELLIAIVAVILVVIILMPFKVALIATSTIPVTIFTSLGIFYAVGMEINTVTLAALIVTLGMIVDDSIVIIDGYVENLEKGMSRWHATIASAEHFFKSILSATLSISITFFPFLVFISGGMSEFLLSFPWGMAIILFVSMYVAQLFVPIIQYFLITKSFEIPKPVDGRKPFSMLGFVQHCFDNLIDLCFAHKRATIAIGFGSVLVGGWLVTKLPQELMPLAERNQFAVEITAPTGTSLQKTVAIADSLEHMMLRDERITTITSFKGTSSPRFDDNYAPQVGGSNYVQFVVNTVSNEATNELIADCQQAYSSYFPNVYVRFKQISFSGEANPVEVNITCSDLQLLRSATDSVTRLLRTMPDLLLVRSNMYEPMAGVKIELNEDNASRMGITNKTLEESMMLRYSNGLEVGTSWDGKYGTKIFLKSSKADYASIEDVLNEEIPVSYGLNKVKLRQVADALPVWHDGQINHRNGIRMATVMAEVTSGKNVIEVTKRMNEQLVRMRLPKEVKLSLGGKYGDDDGALPEILASLIASIVIIFFILLWHFKNIQMPVLMLCCLPFCLMGTAVGVFLTGSSLSMTTVLGIVSLMGILVRDGIILFDYAIEIRQKEKLSVEMSVSESSKRRMRPILLTSFAASMGVIPMLLSGSPLWTPMAAVICFGTIVTLLYIRTVMPVLYAIFIKN